MKRNKEMAGSRQMGAGARQSFGGIMPDKLNKKQAAEFLGISVFTLDKYLYSPSENQRGLRSFRYAGRIYFDKKDLEAYKRSMTQVRAG